MAEKSFPSEAYQKRIAELLRGKKPLARLKVLVLEYRKARSEKTRGEVKQDYLKPQILELYLRLNLTGVIASVETESWLEDVLALSGKEEAELFRGIVAELLDPEVAKVAVFEEEKTEYKVNPDVLEMIEECSLKPEVCKRLGKKPRLQVKKITDKSRREEAREATKKSPRGKGSP